MVVVTDVVACGFRVTIIIVRVLGTVDIDRVADGDAYAEAAENLSQVEFGRNVGRHVDQTPELGRPRLDRECGKAESYTAQGEQHERYGTHTAEGSEGPGRGAVMRPWNEKQPGQMKARSKSCVDRTLKLQTLEMRAKRRDEKRKQALRQRWNSDPEVLLLHLPGASAH